MKTCEHQRHPVITMLIYVLTGGALTIHFLSHLIPVVLLLHCNTLVGLLENPWVTGVAFMFIPLSIYHIWRDGNTHKTIHRLTKERDEAIQALGFMKEKLE